MTATGDNNTSDNAGSSSSGGSNAITTNNTTTTTTAADVIASSNSNNNGNSIKLSDIEAEFQQQADFLSWNILYQEIREKSEREANERHFATSEAERSDNKRLNRYRDVNPYDHSRIVLHRGKTDYINANLVKCERAGRKYILTQGPLEETIGHFWLMVWEQKTRCILMLNKLFEKQLNKCHKYWPDRGGFKRSEEVHKLEAVQLSVEFLRCEEYKNYCRRWFKLTDLISNESREIMQFHYITWPDFGIPSSPVAFLQFLKEVRDSGALDPDVGPAIVHCSAGIGRSGTFCLVDCCLVLSDLEGENNVSVKDILYELRRYRMGLIQTADQLYFSYQAIIEGIKLLKNEAFLDYKEQPAIRNEDEEPLEQHLILDETPPPLPPRTHSLIVNTTDSSDRGGKPLPKIPASESFNDEMCIQRPGDDDNNDDDNDDDDDDDDTAEGHNDDDNNQHNKDALNNLINSSRQLGGDELRAMMSNRPLPPLPPNTKSKLGRVHESDSDENEFYDDDDDDDDDDDEEDELCDEDDDNDNENDNDVDNDNDNNANVSGCGTETLVKSGAKRRAAVEHNNIQANGNEAMLYGSKRETNISSTEMYDHQHNFDSKRRANGLEGAPSNNIGGEGELKRRKRAERQSELEQKVNDIKRKQRESDESREVAKKRRRPVSSTIIGGRLRQPQY